MNQVLVALLGGTAIGLIVATPVAFFFTWTIESLKRELAQARAELDAKAKQQTFAQPYPIIRPPTAFPEPVWISIRGQWVQANSPAEIQAAFNGGLLQAGTGCR